MTKNPSTLALIIVLVLGLIALIVIGTVMGPDILRHFRNQHILKAGIPATATIKAVEDTGNRYNNNPQVKLTLEVTPKDGKPYQAGVIPWLPYPASSPGQSFMSSMTPQSRHTSRSPTNSTGQRMKIIKPQCLSLLTRSYEFQRRFHMGISVIAYVPLGSEQALLPEVELWKFAAESLGKDAALDVCIPKSAAEFLVTGNVYTPEGKPQPACRTAATLGALRKELYVFGDRYWNGTTATEPAPFTEMPLDWAHAFGGPDYARNPLGKGFEPIQVNGKKVQPLPNLEHPDQLITHPGLKPEPTCYGPIDQMWPQRAEKVGTYDEDWLKNDFPGYARDIDWTFFNLAAADQQQSTLFSGNETYRFDNMHPTESVIEGSLPGVHARSFINRKLGDSEAFEEVPLRLTTCWFFPNVKRAVLVD